MTEPRFQAQGTFLRIPYDFRRPSLEKIRHRLYLPGGPMLRPKVWGWGFTLNFAHPGTWFLLGALGTVLALLATVGG